MKVTISGGGKFHLFNLANQLLKRGGLHRLITSYPEFYVKKSGIPKEKVKSIILKEILERGWRRMPAGLRNLYNPQFFISDTFDCLASLFVGNSDIFVGLSSFSLHSIDDAKQHGAVTILESGSSHVLYQTATLKEEYQKFGIKTVPFQTAHPKIIEKELKEYEAADYISIPSKFNKRTFLERGISEAKIIQIPYGVDLSMFRQVPKEDSIFRIVFGGGLSLRKGVHYLLRAFSELQLPNSELLLIGPENEEILPFLKEYEGKFRRIDYQPMKELHKFYSQGSVFIMPSLEEGLALVQPQAMACGLPIIATTNSGAEDIVREGVDGFIIPIRDVDAIKDKILFMYEHPEICKEMGKSAKEHVSSGFTWDDYGNKMIAEYDRILRLKNNV